MFKPFLEDGIDNFVVLVIKLTFASWCCFKTLHFARDMHESESTSSGVSCTLVLEHSCQNRGCARIKHQFLTAERTQM